MILNAKRETLLQAYVKYFNLCVRSFSEVIMHKYRKDKDEKRRGLTVDKISKYFTIRSYNDIKEDIMNEVVALCITIDSAIMDIIEEEDLETFFAEVEYNSNLWTQEYVLKIDKQAKKVSIKLVK